MGNSFYKLIELSNEILYSWLDPCYDKLMEQFNIILFSSYDPHYDKQFYELQYRPMKYYSVSQTLIMINSFHKLQYRPMKYYSVGQTLIIITHSIFHNIKSDCEIEHILKHLLINTFIIFY